MRARVTPRAGYTLVEILLAMVIMLAGGAIAVAFLRHEVDFMETTTLQGDVRTRSQLALNAVAEDLRHATRKAAGSPPNIVIVPGAPDDASLTLFKPDDLDDDLDIVNAAGAIEWDNDTAIVYQHDAAARQLTRTAGGVTRAIAHHVTGVAFEDAAMDAALAADEVRVSLTLEEATPRRDVRATASTIVKLRN